MASRSRRVYIGITGQIEVGARQHKDDSFEDFSRQYRCERLVYFERFGEVHEAIARENN